MLDDIVGFLFSALVGIALLIVVALLARKAMVKEMKASDASRDKAAEEARKKAGEAESRGASGGPNQG